MNSFYGHNLMFENCPVMEKQDLYHATKMLVGYKSTPLAS